MHALSDAEGRRASPSGALRRGREAVVGSYRGARARAATWSSARAPTSTAHAGARLRPQRRPGRTCSAARCCWSSAGPRARRSSSPCAPRASRSSAGLRAVRASLAAYRRSCCRGTARSRAWRATCVRAAEQRELRRPTMAEVRPRSDARVGGAGRRRSTATCDVRWPRWASSTSCATWSGDARDRPRRPRGHRRGEPRRPRSPELPAVAGIVLTGATRSTRRLRRVLDGRRSPCSRRRWTPTRPRRPWSAPCGPGSGRTTSAGSPARWRPSRRTWTRSELERDRARAPGAHHARDVRVRAARARPEDRRHIVLPGGRGRAACCGGRDPAAPRRRGPDAARRPDRIRRARQRSGSSSSSAVVDPESSPLREPSRASTTSCASTGA